MGKPVIRGIRITAESVLERLDAGMSLEEILEAYPQLSFEAIRAARVLAAEVQSRSVAYQP